MNIAFIPSRLDALAIISADALLNVYEMESYTDPFSNNLKENLPGFQYAGLLHYFNVSSPRSFHLRMDGKKREGRKKTDLV